MTAQQALVAANVLRNDTRVFGPHPFIAAGVGIHLLSSMGRLFPEIVGSRNWASDLFPRLEKGRSYGLLVAQDLDSILSVLCDERNADVAKKAIEKADQWGEAVAAGRTDPAFLEDVGSALGQTYLRCYFKAQGNPLPSTAMGSRAAEIFERGMTINGNSFEQGLALDRFHSRKLAFMELASLSAGVHQFNLNEIDFQEITGIRKLQTNLNPSTHAEHYFSELLSLAFKTGPYIRPSILALTVKQAWEREISKDFERTLRWIDAYCQGIDRVSSESEAEAGSAQATPA